MSNITEVDVQIVLVGVTFKEVCLSYQIVHDISLFFIIFKVSHLCASVRRISHVWWYTDKILITFGILHYSLA